MSTSEDDTPPRGPRLALVFLLQLVVVAIVYGPSLRASFASDDWTYLATMRQSVWLTIARPLGYHWQPIACAWVALLRALFGERALAFQLVNLLQLAVFGFEAYLLGRRLGLGSRTCLLASVLTLATGAHFEASYWPLGGNMHLLAAQFYALALILACDVGAGRLGRGGPWWLALATVGAVFSHPAMVTAIPICVLALLLVGRGQGATLASDMRTLVRRAMPLAIAAGLFVVARVATATRLHDVPQIAFERDRFYWLSARGIAGLFSLRGSFEAFVPIMTLGTQVRWPDPRIWLFVGGWIVAGALVGAACWWRARMPGPRLLVTLLAVHMLAITIASGGVTSRQTQLLAVAAALLTAPAAAWVAERVARYGGAAIGAVVAAVPLAVLLAGAFRDHRVAARLTAQSGDLNRTVVARIRERTGPGGSVRTVTVVNMPSSLYESGVTIVAFQNGLPELVRLASRGRAAADMRRADLEGVPPDVTLGCSPIGPAELRSRAASPDHLVLVYDGRTREVRALATSP